MILGFLDNLSPNKYLSAITQSNKIIDIIEKTDFMKMDDGTIKIDNEDLYYILTTYNTSNNIEEKPAEVHRKFIDLQYILYGEEKIGYADYGSPKNAI